MMPEEAFFLVHSDLPREGPGEADDVRWAVNVANTPADARVLDAACGPGADTITLARTLPAADILAVDLHEPFVEQTRAATEEFGARVRAEATSYVKVNGPFDLIWCAGAVYFVGIKTALETWRPVLATGGRVAFSEPAWRRYPPSPAARAFWGDEYEPKPLQDVEAEIAGAGWRCLGQRWIVGPPWAAYYDPLAKRLDALEASGPDPALVAAIAETRAEVCKWRAAPDEIAYSLFVVEPA